MDTKKGSDYSLPLCDSGGIQTHNLLIRSQMLYSVELRNQSVFFSAFSGTKPTIVIPAGFKPPTFWSVVRCSIQLSYGTVDWPSFLKCGAKVRIFCETTKIFRYFFKQKAKKVLFIAENRLFPPHIYHYWQYYYQKYDQSLMSSTERLRNASRAAPLSMPFWRRARSMS